MDEWPIRSGRFNHGRGPILIEKQPTKASERCELARRFLTDFDFPLLLSSNSQSSTMDPTTTKNHHHHNHIQYLVDDPELGDLFEKEYAPWPLRLYLVQDGIITYIAEPKDCSYDEAVLELMQMLQI